MHQPGVGRERHRLGLHRGVDDHLGEVGWLGRAGARGDIQALLEQGGELLLAHALAPARHRRAVEHQRVLKELLAAEQLIIGVLDPALAQNFVGEIVHMLEDRQPCHLKANGSIRPEPRRQGRMAGPVRIDRAEPLLQKAPVDRPRQLRQRMVEIDDLVEPRLEQIVLPAIAPLPWPHRITLHRADGGTESRPKPPFNLQEIKLIGQTFLQKQILAEPRKHPQNMEVQDSSRTTSVLILSFVRFGFGLWRCRGF